PPSPAAAAGALMRSRPCAHGRPVPTTSPPPKSVDATDFLMRDMGAEAVNYATGIKAKALILLADFIDEGQQSGTIRTRADNQHITDPNKLSLPQVLGIEPEMDTPEERKKAATRAAVTVNEARRTRDSLGGAE